jgi:hypothetical protein
VVMLALIVVVCLVAITAMGTAANKTFGNIPPGSDGRHLTTNHSGKNARRRLWGTGRTNAG